MKKAVSLLAALTLMAANLAACAAEEPVKVAAVDATAIVKKYGGTVVHFRGDSPVCTPSHPKHEAALAELAAAGITPANIACIDFPK